MKTILQNTFQSKERKLEQIHPYWRETIKKRRLIRITHISSYWRSLYECKYRKNIELELFEPDVEIDARRWLSGVYRMFYHKGEEKSDSDRYMRLIAMYISCHGRDKYELCT